MSESINITYDSIEFKDISDNILNSIECDANGNLDISGGTLITQDISATDISCVYLQIQGSTAPDGPAAVIQGTLKIDSAGGRDISNSSIYQSGNLWITSEAGALILSAGATKKIHLGSEDADTIVVDVSLQNVGIGTNSPATKLEVVGDITANSITPDTIGSYIYVKHNTSYTRLLPYRTYDNDGFYFGNTGTGGGIEFTGTDVNGSFITLTANTSYTSDTSNYLSDDRLKHNEIPISNALNTVNKIVPMFYIKTKTFYERNKTFADNEIPENSINESGYIAQDISNIRELKHLVSGTEYDASGNPTPLYLNYTGIQPYLTKAIQELHALVLEQKQQILDLSAQVAALS